MIDRSSAYDQAITARRRRITVRATFDLRDPDAVVSGAASSAQSPYSQIAQVYDEITDQTDFKLGTLEQDRIQLDGSWALPPDDPDEVAAEQLGWWGGVLSGADGTFVSPQPYIELSFSGMSILQAFTLWFSQNSYDGVPESFRVDVYSAATLAFSRIVEDNADHQVLIEQFTVHDPTRIRVTMLKWSRPYTYPRLTDLFFGLFEQWSGRDIYSVDVLTESTFTGLSLPYSTCDLEAYNKGHRFDPYAPNSLFLSIEERQAIPIDWGIYLPDGMIEWVPGGWYYQQSGGWEIKDLTVRWSLVDIIGMLVDRNYSPPDTLPTTLGGWIASIVACLGVNLAGRYIVDDEVKDLALRAAVEDVTDLTCGEVLRFACMATAAWAHQDFATGFLRVSKRGYDTGANITGSNMPSWPKMQANEEIADINLGIAIACLVEPVRHGVQVRMSRTRDEDDPLTEEIRECNAYDPDLAVDIHTNAGGGTGFEVYHTLGGGKGKILAQNIEAEVKAIGQTSRGCKTRANSAGKDYYGFIRQTKCPAVICECAFIDTAADRAKVDTADKQAAFGRAYAHGILKTLGIAVQPEQEIDPEVQAAIKTIQIKAGLEEQTIQYLLDYQYGEALVTKLARAME